MGLLLNSNTPNQTQAVDRIAFLQGLLASRIRTPTDQHEIDKAILSLGSDQFDEREKAADFLVRKSRLSIHSLRLATSHSDPEIRRRAKSCLDQIDPELDRRLDFRTEENGFQIVLGFGEGFGGASGILGGKGGACAIGIVAGAGFARNRRYRFVPVSKDFRPVDCFAIMVRKNRQDFKPAWNAE